MSARPHYLLVTTAAAALLVDGTSSAFATRWTGRPIIKPAAAKPSTRRSWCSLVVDAQGDLIGKLGWKPAWSALYGDRARLIVARTISPPAQHEEELTYPRNATIERGCRLRSTSSARLFQPLYPLLIQATSTHQIPPDAPAPHSAYKVRLLGHGVCTYCGRRATLTVDHLVPRSRGGANTWYNTRGACSDCNGSKADRELTSQALDRLLTDVLDPRQRHIRQAEARAMMHGVERWWEPLRARQVVRAFPQLLEPGRPHKPPLLDQLGVAQMAQLLQPN
jgi:5-methylcytosine-specific restriction endonuclease McrA